MAVPAVGQAQDRQQTSERAFGLLGRFAPVIFLILVGAFITSQEPNFLTERNLLNVMRQISFIGILAVGMTFVILTAGIDLSVGSLVAFTGVICAWVAKDSRVLMSGEDPGGIRVLWAALAAMGVGLLIGILQGSIIAYAGIPAFVVTLGGLGAWRGATLVTSDGQPLSTVFR